MISKIVSLILCIILLMGSTGILADDLEIGAEAYLVADFDSGTILLGKNVDLRLAIASLTKLMTYYVAMDIITERGLDLDSIYRVSAEAASIGGSSYLLRAGEEVTLRELLFAIIIVSGNDAAFALAEALSPTIGSFIDRMNDRALELGMKDTVFLNVHGLPDGDGIPSLGHFSTARDMLIMVYHLLRDYPQITEISSMERLIVGRRDFDGPSTNRLLGLIEGVDGLKTGYTGEAGFCFISTAKVSGFGDKRLVVITLNSPTREISFNENSRLYQIIKSQYSHKKLFSSGEIIDTIPIENGASRFLDLYSDRLGSIIYDRTQGEVSTIVTTYKDLKAPINKNQRLGTLLVMQGGRVIAEYPLLASESVKKASWLQRLWRAILSVFGRL